MQYLFHWMKERQELGRLVLKASVAVQGDRQPSSCCSIALEDQQCMETQVD